MFTEKEYEQYKALFYNMWRARANNDELLTVSCPACTIANRVSDSATNGAVLLSLRICNYCPIDWSYLPDADKIDPPYCRAEGSRYNRYKETLDSCGYDISPEVKEVVQEIIDKTKWRSYDELMHTKRMRRR